MKMFVISWHAFSLLSIMKHFLRIIKYIQQVYIKHLLWKLDYTKACGIHKNINNIELGLENFIRAHVTLTIVSN